MAGARASVKSEKQYDALRDKGMSKERAARIANTPNASSNGGKKYGSGGDSQQGGTTAQHKAAGRKGARHRRARPSDTHALVVPQPATGTIPKAGGSGPCHWVETDRDNATRKWVYQCVKTS